MRYPDFLPDGGRIGFIAPSFGCTTEPYASCFDEAVRNFESMGYKCVEGPNCREEKGLGKSNTPEKCGEEINEFFLKDRSDIIISCGGGETMSEDLPFVDFERIGQAKPKWFMGYSDNTNLVLTLPTLCDTAAIYGPNAPSFGQRPRHQSLDDAFSLLKGDKLRFTSYPQWEKPGDEEYALAKEENPYLPYNCTEPNNIKLAGSAAGQKGVSFSGRMLGGCLELLLLLCGTRYDKVKEFNQRYKEDGVVWFIEACEFNSLDVRRSLWALSQAGWFENAAGFIMGRPGNYEDCSLGLSQEQAVTDALKDFKLPIILNADIGHLPPQMPVIAGACGEVKAEPQSLTLEYYLQ